MLNVSKGPEGGRTMAEEKRGVQLGEIAERLGISRSTVSFVLNGRGDEMRISKQTQERIRRTAREMDYQPNLNAQRLRHSASGIQSQSIAMFWCDHYGAETLGRFISGGCSSGRESGLQTEYALHIFHYDELHQYRELLSSNYYSGIVINGGSDNDIEFLSQVNFQVPAVFSGRSVSGIICVYVDSYALGKRCARVIADQGYTSVGVIGCRRTTPGASLRLTGFLDGCEAYGIQTRPEWLIASSEVCVDGGYKGMAAIAACEEKPDILFIMTDTEAIGTVIYMKEKGIFDQIPLMIYGTNKTIRMMAPNATYADFAIEEISRKTIETLNLLIHSGISAPISQLVTPNIEIGCAPKR